jgi:hypothetical protein
VGGRAPAEAAPAPRPGAAADIAALQRLAGNRAVTALLRAAGPAADALPAAPAPVQQALQRRHHNHGRRAGAAVQPPVAALPATMRVQVQSKKPRYDDGIGLTEAVAGAGVTTAQIQAAIATMIARFPSRGGRDALNDTVGEVLADLATRVNPAGEQGRNNSTSWRVDDPDYTGFRIDVENIRGRNLYA